MIAFNFAARLAGTPRDRLIDRVRRREVRRIVYFHTDHFEPCRNFDGRPIFGDANTADVARFADRLSQIECARRLTLFYKPQLNFEVRTGADMMYASPDDTLGFVRRTERDMAIAKSMMRPLAQGTDVEFQLHVHHENYTSNATVTAADTAVGRYLKSEAGAAHDSARFEYAVGLNLEILAQETRKSFARWFFVHGHWALNASDDRDCRIVDEIDILYRNGCRGDFTFPAGRPHVDSRHELPYLCRPVNVAKGYDTPAAEPEPAAGAGRARGEERFLIWGSTVKHDATSIDHNSGFVRRRAEDLEAAAGKIIDTSYAHDGTLYVKTHAHSMHPAYFDGSAPACFPHEYPATRDMLSLVFDAGTGTGANIAFLTASEVYDELLSSSVKPSVDMQQAFRAPPPRAALVAKSPEKRKPAPKPAPKPRAGTKNPAVAKNPAIQYSGPARQSRNPLRRVLALFGKR